jgi:predicted DNA binding CopG/RHH family protein
MKSIKLVLDKEKELNNRCGVKTKKEDYEIINNEFEKLFNNEYYKNTSLWLDENRSLSLHDSRSYNFSQKRIANMYNISFVLDYITIYDENSKGIGYITNSIFLIKSKDSLRDFSNKTIMNFLIDEKNKEVAFLYLKNNKRETISISYEDISFNKGIVNYYSN